MSKVLTQIAEENRTADAQQDRDNNAAGSFPGMMNLATIPASRPMMIKPIHPMNFATPSLVLCIANYQATDVRHSIGSESRNQSALRTRQ